MPGIPGMRMQQKGIGVRGVAFAGVEWYGMTRSTVMVLAAPAIQLIRFFSAII